MFTNDFPIFYTLFNATKVLKITILRKKKTKKKLIIFYIVKTWADFQHITFFLISRLWGHKKVKTTIIFRQMTTDFFVFYNFLLPIFFFDLWPQMGNLFFRVFTMVPPLLLKREEGDRRE